VLDNRVKKKKNAPESLFMSQLGKGNRVYNGPRKKRLGRRKRKTVIGKWTCEEELAIKAQGKHVDTTNLKVQNLNL